MPNCIGGGREEVSGRLGPDEESGPLICPLAPRSVSEVLTDSGALGKYPPPIDPLRPLSGDCKGETSGAEDC